MASSGQPTPDPSNPRGRSQRASAPSPEARGDATRDASAQDVTADTSTLTSIGDASSFRPATLASAPQPSGPAPVTRSPQASTVPAPVQPTGPVPSRRSETPNVARPLRLSEELSAQQYDDDGDVSTSSAPALHTYPPESRTSSSSQPSFVSPRQRRSAPPLPTLQESGRKQSGSPEGSSAVWADTSTSYPSFLPLSFQAPTDEELDDLYDQGLQPSSRIYAPVVDLVHTYSIEMLRSWVREYNRDFNTNVQRKGSKDQLVERLLRYPRAIKAIDWENGRFLPFDQMQRRPLLASPTGVPSPQAQASTSSTAKGKASTVTHGESSAVPQPLPQSSSRTDEGERLEEDRARHLQDQPEVQAHPSSPSRPRSHSLPRESQTQEVAYTLKEGFERLNSRFTQQAELNMNTLDYLEKILDRTREADETVRDVTQQFSRVAAEAVEESNKAIVASIAVEFKAALSSFFDRLTSTPEKLAASAAADLLTSAGISAPSSGADKTAKPTSGDPKKPDDSDKGSKAPSSHHTEDPSGPDKPSGPPDDGGGGGPPSGGGGGGPSGPSGPGGGGGGPGGPPPGPTPPYGWPPWNVRAWRYHVPPGVTHIELRREVPPQGYTSSGEPVPLAISGPSDPPRESTPPAGAKPDRWGKYPPLPHQQIRFMTTEPAPIPAGLQPDYSQTAQEPRTQQATPAQASQLPSQDARNNPAQTQSSYGNPSPAQQQPQQQQQHGAQPAPDPDESSFRLHPELYNFLSDQTLDERTFLHEQERKEKERRGESEEDSIHRADWHLFEEVPVPDEMIGRAVISSRPGSAGFSKSTMKRLKFDPPFKFSGEDRSLMTDWAKELKRYYAADPEAYHRSMPGGDYRRILAMSHAAEKAPADLLDRLLDEYVAKTKTYEQVCNAFLKAYDDPRRYEKALNALRDLRQDGDVIDYITAFDAKVRDVAAADRNFTHKGMSAMLATFFKEGLSYNILQGAATRTFNRYNFDAWKRVVQDVQQDRMSTMQRTSPGQGSSQPRGASRPAAPAARPAASSGGAAASSSRRPPATSTPPSRTSSTRTPSSSTPTRKINAAASQSSGSVPAHIKCHQCGRNHYLRDCPNRAQWTPAQINFIDSYLNSFTEENEAESGSEDEPEPEPTDNAYDDEQEYGDATEDEDERDPKGKQREQPQAVIAVTRSRADAPSLLYTRLTLNGEPIVALVDTGSDSSWISESHAPRSSRRIALPRPLRPTGFRKSDDDVFVTHKAVCRVSLPGAPDVVSRDDFNILPDAQFEALVGLDWLSKHKVDISLSDNTIVSKTFGPIPLLGRLDRDHVDDAARYLHTLTTLHATDFNRDPTPEEEPWAYAPEFEDLDVNEEVTPEELELIPEHLRHYADVFSKKRADKLPPLRPLIDLRIEFVENAKLPVARPYKLTQDEQKALDEWLDQNIAQGFIRHSNSPLSSACFFVPKPGGKRRLVVDYKRVNDITIKDRYVLPRIDHIFDHVAKGKLWSKIDLRGAYNLMRVRAGDEWKTAFRTHKGTFETLVMPFGLCNAPAAFQRWVDSIFSDIQNVYVQVYLDDIIIYSNSKKEHDEHVKEVLDRLRVHRLYASPAKCAFYQTELHYLGHVVSAGRVSMDDSKVAAILDWKLPRTIKEVQRWMGVANYYRKFINRFSIISQPMTDLLKDESKARLGIKSDRQIFDLPEDAVYSFKRLKEAFSTAQVLHRWEPDLPVTIETDASNFAWSAVASQDVGADPRLRRRPVAFLSRSFKAAELNYDIHDKELLAIIEALREWRHYVLGGPPFNIVTDHQNLTRFLTTKELSPRQVRWASFMAQFRFNIVYRPGVHNQLTDFLSRREDLAEEALSLPTSNAAGYVDRDEVKAPRKRPRIVGKLLTPHSVVTEGGGKVSPELIDTTPVEPPTTEPEPNSPPKDDDDEFVTPPPPAINLVSSYTRYTIEEDELTLSIKKAQAALAPLLVKDLLEQGVVKTGDHLFFKDALYVPDEGDLRLQSLQRHHDMPDVGHQGQRKTLARLRRHYAWPGDVSAVNSFVRSCTTCQRNKSSRTLPPGPLRPLEIPTQPWQSISIDRIVQLPPSNGFTAIVVIVDRFTKMALFVPSHDSFSAQDLGNLMFDKVLLRFGCPREIISDRGPEFASQLWGTICEKIGIKRRLSTAYHPQTDGQTERVNQTLEQYLRHYVGYHQNDWADLLPIAEFCYNSTDNASTRVSPFMALYNYQPDLGRTLVDELTPRVAAFTSQEARARLRAFAKDAQEQAEHYFNQYRAKLPTYKKGDLVMLSSKNLKVKRPTKKLAEPWLGPFKVLKQVSTHAYQIEVPRDWGTFNTFNITLLKPFEDDPFKNRNQPAPEPVEVDGELEYYVEAIVDHQPRRRKPYKVRWTGYDEETWESYEDIKDTAAYKTFAAEAARKAARKRPRSRQ